MSPDPLTEAKRRLDAVAAAGQFIFPGSDLDLIADLVGIIEEARTAASRAVEQNPGKVGRDHPGTSKHAASVPRFGSQRWTVLDVLAENGSHGATAAEVATAIAGVSPNQVATRLLELREAGLAARARSEDGGWLRRQTSAAGTKGAVHVITALGVSVLEAEARRGAA
jgi:DNA-binding transcriptional ArsR family regulator